jgi:DNA-binding NarL/FixJ family response regulator
VRAGLNRVSPIETRRIASVSTSNVTSFNVRMPRADGFDLLEYLQKQNSSAACILLTTFDDDDAVLRGIRLGARGYLLSRLSTPPWSILLAILRAGRYCGSV